jgi:ribosomal protein S18 acetylase RimI-like enzyme
MVVIRRLLPDNWPQLRRIRLQALRDSPHAFASIVAVEERFGAEEWRRLIRRGAWLVAEPKTGPEAEPKAGPETGTEVGSASGGASEPVGVVAALEEPGWPAAARHVTSLWVQPAWRGSGVGAQLLRALLHGLSEEGVELAWLWVLDGNDAARRLYERHGFVSTGERQSLPADPTRIEERMRLLLV